MVDNDSPAYIEGCDQTVMYPDDIYKCMTYKPLGGAFGNIEATTYDDAKIKCGEAFDTGADGRSCASLVFYAEDGETSASCSAYTQAESVDFPEEDQVEIDAERVANPEMTYEVAAALGGMQLAVGSAAATLAATYLM